MATDKTDKKTTKVDTDYDEELFPTQEEYTDFAKDWGEAQEENEKADPTGNFIVEITDATFGTSKGGRKQIHYELKVHGGKSDGVTINKYDGLGSPGQMQMAQKSLGNLGIDITKLSPKTLPAVVLDTVGTFVHVLGKQSEQFYNIYFNRIASKKQVAAAKDGKDTEKGKVF